MVTADAFRFWQDNVNNAAERENKREYWPMGIDRQQTWWKLENVFSECLKKYDPAGRRKFLKSMLSVFDMFTIKVTREDGGKSIDTAIKCN